MYKPFICACKRKRIYLHDYGMSSPLIWFSLINIVFLCTKLIWEKVSRAIRRCLQTFTTTQISIRMNEICLGPLSVWEVDLYLTRHWAKCARSQPIEYMHWLIRILYAQAWWPIFLRVVQVYCDNNLESTQRVELSFPTM